MRKIPFTLALVFLILAGPGRLSGQSGPGLSGLSVSATTVAYGVPGMLLTPIHPGVEIGAIVLERQKEKSSRHLGLDAGYYYHELIAHAIYLNGSYCYQRRFAGLVGLNLSAGPGYLQSTYPGTAYAYQASEGEFVARTSTRGFGTIHAGLGLSYTGSQRVEPFVHYAFTFLNPWEMNFYVRTTAVLKAGIRVRLTEKTSL